MPKEITDPELTNVEVVKTVTDESGDGFVTPGELLTYTLNISNLGKMFQDDVTITDDIVDPNLDLSTAKIIQAQVSGSDITPVVTTNGTKVMVNMGTIHNASTGKLVFTIKAKDTFTSAKTISNTASVTSLVHQDPFNSSTATIDVDTTGLNDLLVTKTVEDSTTSTNDGVIDEPNGYAGLEEVLHYNVNIENNGLRAATGIIVTDDMDDPELNDATLTNVVVKYGDQVLVEDTGDGLGDYSVRYGDALTVITNPAYELPVGKSLDISFDITTKVDSLESGLVENTVFVKADDMADASGFASIPRDLSDAKLSINKTVTEGSSGTIVNVDNYATPGEELRYKITLKNIGTTPITDVTITDSLDTTKFDMTKGVYNLVYTDKDGLEHTNLTPSSTYLLSTDLASNDVATLEFSVDLLPTFDGSFNTVKNTATASFVRGDNDIPTYTSTASLPIDMTSIDNYDLTTSKTSAISGDTEAFAKPGDVIDYSIVVKNEGDIAQNNVVIYDTPDTNIQTTKVYSDLVVVSDQRSLVQGTDYTITIPSLGAKNLSVKLNKVNAGETITLNYNNTVSETLNVPSGATEFSIDNAATITSKELPNDVSNNVSDKVLFDLDDPIYHNTSLVHSVVDASGDEIVTPNEKVTYTATYTNNSPIAQYSSVFKNELADMHLDKSSVTNVSVKARALSDSNIINVSPTSYVVDTTNGLKITFNEVPANTEYIVSYDVVAASSYMNLDPIQGDVTVTETNNTEILDTDSDPLTKINVDAIASVSTHIEVSDDVVDNINKNGLVQPGETLSYTNTIKNNGQLDQTNVYMINYIADYNLKNSSDFEYKAFYSIDGGELISMPNVTLDDNDGHNTGFSGLIPELKVGQTATVTYIVKTNDMFDSALAVLNSFNVSSDQLIEEYSGANNAEIPVDIAQDGVSLIDVTGTYTDSTLPTASAGEDLFIEFEVHNKGRRGESNLEFTPNFTDSNLTGSSELINVVRTSDGANLWPSSIVGDTLNFKYRLDPNDSYKITYKIKAQDVFTYKEDNSIHVSGIARTSISEKQIDTGNVSIPMELGDNRDHNLSAVKTVKDASGDTLVTPGELLTYTIEISNNGNVYETGISVHDKLLDKNLDRSTVRNVNVTGLNSDQTFNIPTDEKWTVNISALNPGQTVKVEFKVKAMTNFVDAVSIDNVLTVDTDYYVDPIMASASIDINQSYVNLHKLVLNSTVKDDVLLDLDDIAQPGGETLTYVTSISNQGLMDEANVVLTNPFGDDNLDASTAKWLSISYDLAGSELVPSQNYSVSESGEITIYNLPVGKTVYVTHSILSKDKFNSADYIVNKSSVVSKYITTKVDSNETKIATSSTVDSGHDMMISVNISDTIGNGNDLISPLETVKVSLNVANVRAVQEDNVVVELGAPIDGNINPTSLTGLVVTDVSDINNPVTIDPSSYVYSGRTLTFPKFSGSSVYKIEFYATANETFKSSNGTNEVKFVASVKSDDIKTPKVGFDPIAFDIDAITTDGTDSYTFTITDPTVSGGNGNGYAEPSESLHYTVKYTNESLMSLYDVNLRHDGVFDENVTQNIRNIKIVSSLTGELTPDRLNIKGPANYVIYEVLAGESITIEYDVATKSTFNSATEISGYRISELEEGSSAYTYGQLRAEASIPINVSGLVDLQLSDSIVDYVYDASGSIVSGNAKADASEGLTIKSIVNNDSPVAVDDVLINSVLEMDSNVDVNTRETTLSLLDNSTQVITPLELDVDYSISGNNITLIRSIPAYSSVIIETKVTTNEVIDITNSKFITHNAELVYGGTNSLKTSTIPISVDALSNVHFVDGTQSVVDNSNNSLVAPRELLTYSINVINEGSIIEKDINLYFNQVDEAAANTTISNIKLTYKDSGLPVEYTRTGNDYIVVKQLNPGEEITFTYDILAKLKLNSPDRMYNNTLLQTNHSVTKQKAITTEILYDYTAIDHTNLIVEHEISDDNPVTASIEGDNTLQPTDEFVYATATLTNNTPIAFSNLVVEALLDDANFDESTMELVYVKNLLTGTVLIQGNGFSLDGPNRLVTINELEADTKIQVAYKFKPTSVFNGSPYSYSKINVDNPQQLPEVISREASIPIDQEFVVDATKLSASDFTVPVGTILTDEDILRLSNTRAYTADGRLLPSSDLHVIHAESPDEDAELNTLDPTLDATSKTLTEGVYNIPVKATTTNGGLTAHQLVKVTVTNESNPIVRTGIISQKPQVYSALAGTTIDQVFSKANPVLFDLNNGNIVHKESLVIGDITNDDGFDGSRVGVYLVEVERTSSLTGQASQDIIPVFITPFGTPPTGYDYINLKGSDVTVYEGHYYEYFMDNLINATLNKAGVTSDVTSSVEMISSELELNGNLDSGAIKGEVTSGTGEYLSLFQVADPASELVDRNAFTTTVLPYVEGNTGILSASDFSVAEGNNLTSADVIRHANALGYDVDGSVVPSENLNVYNPYYEPVEGVYPAAITFTDSNGALVHARITITVYAKGELQYEGFIDSTDPIVYQKGTSFTKQDILDKSHASFTLTQDGVMLSSEKILPTEIVTLDGLKGDGTDLEGRYNVLVTHTDASTGITASDVIQVQITPTGNPLNSILTLNTPNAIIYEGEYYNGYNFIPDSTNGFEAYEIDENGVKTDLSIYPEVDSMTLELSDDDGDAIEDIMPLDGHVLSTPGTYYIKYTLDDPKGVATSVDSVSTITVLSRDDASTISANDFTVQANSLFDETVILDKSQVQAFDLNGDNITSDVYVSYLDPAFDISKVGNYKATLSVLDKTGATISTDIIINVVDDGITRSNQIIADSPLFYNPTTDGAKTLVDVLKDANTTYVYEEDGQITYYSKLVDEVVNIKQADGFDPTKEGVYNIVVTNTYEGMTAQSIIQVYVTSNPETIGGYSDVSSEDVSIVSNSYFDPLLQPNPHAYYVDESFVETDIEITTNEIVFNNVDITTAGTYYIIYQITDPQGTISRSISTITVTDSEATRGTLTANDFETKVANNFSSNVERDAFIISNSQATGYMSNGNIATLEVIETNLDVTTIGEYTAVISFMDSTNSLIVEQITIRVVDASTPIVRTPTIAAKSPLTYQVSRARAVGSLSQITTDANPHYAEYDANDVYTITQLTDADIIDDGGFNPSVVGTYYVKYYHQDPNSGLEAAKVVTVYVTADGLPPVSATYLSLDSDDVTIYAGDYFDTFDSTNVVSEYHEGTTVTNTRENVYVASTNLNSSVATTGKDPYKIVFTITYEGITQTHVSNITVLDETTDRGYLSANDYTINLGTAQTTLDIINNSHAIGTDVDGSLVNPADMFIIDSNLDPTKVGIYDVVFGYVDQNNATVTTAIKVNVVAKTDPISNVRIIANSPLVYNMAVDNAKTIDDVIIDSEALFLEKLNGMNQVPLLLDSSNTTVISDDGFDATVPGIYYVIIEHTGVSGLVGQTTIQVQVTTDGIPLSEVVTIEANDVSLYVNSAFDPMYTPQVIAYDTLPNGSNVDITSDVQIIYNNVDMTKAGNYNVAYYVRNENGIYAYRLIEVTVLDKDLANQSFIVGNDFTVKRGTKLTNSDIISMSEAFARDVDGTIISSDIYLSGTNLDTTKVGSYSAQLSVINADGVTITTTIVIKVVALDSQLDSAEIIASTPQVYKVATNTTINQVLTDANATYIYKNTNDVITYSHKLTSIDVIDSDGFNPNVVGTYNLIVAYQYNGLRAQEVIEVIITDDGLAAKNIYSIDANNVVMKLGSAFNPLITPNPEAFITKADGTRGEVPLTLDNVVYNDVNPNKVGIYTVIYNIIDDEGLVHEKLITVNVVGESDSLVQLNANDFEVSVNTPYTDINDFILQYSKANAHLPNGDDVSGDIIVSETNLDITKPGLYSAVIQTEWCHSN